MIIHAVKCEMCEKQYHFNPMQKPVERDIPTTWLMLAQGNPQLNDSWDFCSTQCLRQWLVEHSYVSKDGSPVKIHMPYLNCCELHYPLGMRESKP